MNDYTGKEARYKNIQRHGRLGWIENRILVRDIHKVSIRWILNREHTRHITATQTINFYQN